MQFEWDEDKERVNVQSHDGLDFRTAARVFDDPHFVLLQDRIDEESGEQRWHAIGLAGSVPLLIVVHVYREDKYGEEIVRIISARKANKRESRRYFQ